MKQRSTIDKASHEGGGGDGFGISAEFLSPREAPMPRRARTARRSLEGAPREEKLAFHMGGQVADSTNFQSGNRELSIERDIKKSVYPFKYFATYICCGHDPLVFHPEEVAVRRPTSNFEFCIVPPSLPPLARSLLSSWRHHRNQYSAPNLRRLPSHSYLP